MQQKKLKFSVNQLIIDGSKFDSSSFVKLPPEDLETHDITLPNSKSKETLSIKKIVLNNIDSRFLSIYFIQGEKYPYSKTVIDNKLKEIPNPRDPNEIELDDQFFVLIDINRQRIYLSDQKRRFIIKNWLSDKIGAEIILKSIIEEQEFVDKIKAINSVSFTVVPNLLSLSSEEGLAKVLTEDIFGFGADKARLEFFYKDSHMTEDIANRLKSLIGRKNEYKEITVVGRDEEDFESIFNLEGIVNKVTIDVNLGNDTKLLNPELVFDILIEKVKEYD